MDLISHRWLRLLVLVLPLVLVVAACSGDDGEASETTVTTDAADVDSGRPTRTTIPVDELGEFELGELQTIGIVTNRIIEWVVIGDGRYVAFTQPPGEERGARVRVLDRSRAKVRTVDADLSSVSALHPAGDDGGVAYLSSTGPARSISFVAVDGEPVGLVSVRAGTTNIDSVAVDPTQNHVVWRELRQGRVQVLLSSDLDGGSVVLDESVSDGMIGEGAEDPIVLTEEGTVRYYADPDADGEATWYEVPIDGGAPAEVAAP